MSKIKRIFLDKSALLALAASGSPKDELIDYLTELLESKALLLTGESELWNTIQVIVEASNSQRAGSFLELLTPLFTEITGVSATTQQLALKMSENYGIQLTTALTAATAILNEVELIISSNSELDLLSDHFRRTPPGKS